MSVSQISVFTESKPGHLSRILESLNEARVNVRGYSVSDTGEYGIARFIVDDIGAAIAALEEEGRAFTTASVICMRLEDMPGELGRVFKILAEKGINVNYSYSMISTFIILNVDDTEYAKGVLHDAGFKTISQDQIASIDPNAL